MATSVLNAPHFQNEDEAFAYVEARLWPNGPVCPHCGNSDQKRIRKMAGQDHPQGPLQVQRLPEALHRAHGDHLRKLATWRCISGFRSST